MSHEVYALCNRPTAIISYGMIFFLIVISTIIKIDANRVSVERMVQKWAPLVWLAPGEKFFPTEVSKFLRYVTVRTSDTESENLPIGPKSEHMFLVTKSNIGKFFALYSIARVM